MLAEILQIRMLHIGDLIRQSLDVQQSIRPSLKIPIRESFLHMLELALNSLEKTIQQDHTWFWNWFWECRCL